MQLNCGFGQLGEIPVLYAMQNGIPVNAPPGFMYTIIGAGTIDAYAALVPDPNYAVPAYVAPTPSTVPNTAPASPSLPPAPAPPRDAPINIREPVAPTVPGTQSLVEIDVADAYGATLTASPGAAAPPAGGSLVPLLLGALALFGSS